MAEISGAAKAVRDALAILEGSALAWLIGRDTAGTMGVNPGVRVVIDQPLGIGRTVAGHLEHTTLKQLRQLLRNLGLRTVLAARTQWRH